MSKSNFDGTQLRQYRQQSGLTQTQVSSILSISGSTLSRIERAVTPLPNHMVPDLCDLYHIDPEDFRRRN